MRSITDGLSAKRRDGPVESPPGFYAIFKGDETGERFREERCHLVAALLFLFFVVSQKPYGVVLQNVFPHVG